MYCYLSVLSYILILVLMLINVAFLTLLERKILSYIQIRKGPNKISFIGILQPMADVVKLFTKESMFLMSSNYLIYYFCPMFSIFFIMGMWIIYPSSEGILNMDFSWIFLITVFSFTVYPILISGWSSNSKFSFLGAVRGVAQIISYEVVFTLLVFLILLISNEGAEVNSIMIMNEYFPPLMMFPFIYFLWIFTCIMESNRSPFDFAEGESELVSGFNTEYSSGGFALIFMAEYLSILFLSMLSACLINNNSGFIFIFILWANSFIWIWLRGTFPRHRYDLIMQITWKSILPFLGNFTLWFLILNITLFF